MSIKTYIKQKDKYVIKIDVISFDKCAGGFARMSAIFFAAARNCGRIESHEYEVYLGPGVKTMIGVYERQLQNWADGLIQAEELNRQREISDLVTAISEMGYEEENTK